MTLPRSVSHSYSPVGHEHDAAVVVTRRKREDDRGDSARRVLDAHRDQLAIAPLARAEDWDVWPFDDAELGLR